MSIVWRRSSIIFEPSL